MASRTASVRSATHAGADRAATEAILLAVALAFLAAAIHAVAGAEHFSEFWLFGVFFCALAIAQLAWGVWCFARPTPASLVAGVALNASVIAVWLVSRTVGVPLGPGAWKPEQVGALDIAATLDECLIVGLLYLLTRGSVRLEVLRVVVRPLAYVVLIGSGVVLVMGGHHAN
jgi:hypothetical protein